MAALDAVLEKSFEESAAPGVVGAVQTPEYTWGVRVLGVVDRTSQEQMTLEVHHRIGSATKTFTGTLLLQATDEGLLSLDDTIDRYVAGIPNGDKVTLRQMANHTSGIASYTEDKQFGGVLGLGDRGHEHLSPKNRLMLALTADRPRLTTNV